jgi:hypothetical protein
MTKSTLTAIVLAFGLLVGFAHLALAQSLPEQGESCGGVIGAQCAKGLWCDSLPGLCGAPLKGTCERVPQACTMEYKPVCGCNGHTYSNDCVRRSAKVGLRRAGACMADMLKVK